MPGRFDIFKTLPRMLLPLIPSFPRITIPHSSTVDNNSYPWPFSIIWSHHSIVYPYTYPYHSPLLALSIRLGCLTCTIWFVIQCLFPLSLLSFYFLFFPFLIVRLSFSRSACLSVLNRICFRIRDLGFF
jgi:hypothetical protein